MTGSIRTGARHRFVRSAKKSSGYYLAAIAIAALLFGVTDNGFAQDECMDCHDDPTLTKVGPSGREISLYIDLFVYRGSIHGDFDCVDCHADTDPDDLPHDDQLEKVDCSMCHDDVLEEYEKSIHAVGLRNGAEDAPTCADCHGRHDIYPSSDPKAKTYVLNLAATCATCHADPKIVKKYHIPVRDPLEAYENSVHGVALMSESNFDAATCSNCHGSHEIRTMADPESPVYWTHVSRTCGQCHPEIATQFDESVHGVAVSKGVRQAPVCTDCHGEHGVKAKDDPDSPVHPLRVSHDTCERCHASEMMSQRYGIAEARVSTFEDSYHGLAIKGGSLAAANCASCHGIHNILASSDPNSLVHPANLQNTCGQCHPNATENVAKGPVHLTTSTTPGRIVNWVQRIYIYVIIVVIGGMIIHNVFDFVRRIQRRRWLKAHGVPSHVYQIEKHHVRWLKGERIQHWSLVVSFVLLVITGFALKYPDTWWVRGFVGFEWLFNVRGLLHRVAGAAFIVLSFYHLYYMFLTRRGRTLTRAFVIGSQDIRDICSNMLYYIGLRQSPPRADHFNYMEKLEYYALVWGTIVMGLTGLMLWFEEVTLALFPRWVIDLVTVIHLYEAWLATLAIVVWHFYFVIFNPDVYPVNTTMITGNISDEEMRDEYYREWERLHKPPEQKMAPAGQKQTVS
jgi:formate dehydrogenase gamma subunit